jgi:hypothetical protein
MCITLITSGVTINLGMIFLIPIIEGITFYNNFYSEQDTFSKFDFLKPILC